jgi:hypothetical protein
MSVNDGTMDSRTPGGSADGEPPDLEANIKSRSTWMRLVFMIVLGALYALSRLVVFAVVVLQFLWVLLTSEPNVRLTALGHALAIYTADIIDYLCYVSEERPFPFDKDWPA